MKSALRVLGLRRPVIATARIRFALGVFTALAVTALCGELFLRVAPPGDLATYLGDDSGTRGPYAADASYGARYASLERLRAEHRGKLDPFLDQQPTRPVWAFFGSSFAQAPGMLGDTATQLVPQRQSLYLGKNELVPVRCSQAEQILAAGVRPERIFFVLIPLDAWQFASHGLDQYRVNADGALTFEPRWPRLGGPLIGQSRLALKGYLRTGLQQNLPGYNRSKLMTTVDPALERDLRTVFTRFAGCAKSHAVPVTLVLLPNYEQVTQGKPHAIQEVYTAIGRDLGWDVCDVCSAFRDRNDHAALFIPDKHFSALGNRVLLAALLAHLKAIDPATAGLSEVRP